MVPAAHRSTLLPHVPLAWGRHVPQDRTHVGASASPPDGSRERRRATGRRRRRFSGRGCRAAAGPTPGTGAPTGRIPDPPAGRRPAARPADGAARGETGPQAEVGQTSPSAALWRSLAGGLARGQGVALRTLAAGALEGGGVPVARGGAAGEGQGGRGRGGGVQEALYPGQQRARPDGAATAGDLLCPLPARGRVPGSRPFTVSQSGSNIAADKEL